MSIAASPRRIAVERRARLVVQLPRESAPLGFLAFENRIDRFTRNPFREVNSERRARGECFG